MPGLIPGFEYDIFISYRQKDNRYESWVSDFVDDLRKELDATFKEDINVYFDINPCDGLLETHDVDASLKTKLKSLIFIPVISRTYCDPRSYAWEHEFMAFVENSSKDGIGLTVVLPDGNVARRVIPVCIHDLDYTDMKAYETALGSPLRGIEFIYREPGVNRPLTRKDDGIGNLNKTKYRNQINKVALAIREIISSLKNEPFATFKKIETAVKRISKESSAEEKSIIVLPFDNISRDPDQDYFSDGLTEEIITDLSHINHLHVISRSSAMTFKGTKKTLPEIAESVNVRYVLEGSVRKSNNNLRITAQLIDARTDTHIWAEKYNGTIVDVFDIQEKVSLAIAGSLKLKLSTVEEELISMRPIDNVQAYEYFLQARQEIYRFTEEGFDRSLVLLRNGIEITGENELFYTMLGTAYCMAYRAGIKSEAPNFQKIEECVSVLFRLNPESPGGHYLLGSLCDIRSEFQKAAKEYAKCLVSDGSNTDCMLQLSRIYCAAGKMEEARILLEKILALDPLNLAIVYSMPGYLKLLAGRFEEAVGLYRKMYDIDPVSPLYRLMYSWALIYSGRKEDAIRIIEQLATDNPGSAFTDFALVYKYALSGDIEKLRKHVTPELEAAAGAAEYTSREMSNAYAIIGEKEKSIEWLEKSIDCGFINYPFILKHNPFMKVLYDEPAFIRLMERVKHLWETFEL